MTEEARSNARTTLRRNNIIFPLWADASLLRSSVCRGPSFVKRGEQARHRAESIHTPFVIFSQQNCNREPMPRFGVGGARFGSAACSEVAIGPFQAMAYRDRSSRNWGALVATALAVPATFTWFVIESFVGSMVCEGVEGPCRPSLVDLFGGMIGIAAIAAALGWLLNRIVERVSNDR